MGKVLLKPSGFSCWITACQGPSGIDERSRPCGAGSKLVEILVVLMKTGRNTTI
jgi:hypothetical protein